ncbi:ran GTPase-activating protein 1-like [Physella acuta]|uniref:ran GTPase-activating protein 1-like n=1 Tax=Physella acuta TaxID=109671 RepID=UPI0027DC7D78|nr:ran GTPase-activating protein 1-like [Physella acuta]
MTSIDDVTDKFAKARVDNKFELSFKGRGLKLNSREDAKEIVDAIRKCSNLTALRMEGNTLGVDAAEEIAKALGHHPEFERALWSDMFTGRLKTEIPVALKHLGAAIIGAKCRLVEIDLSDNAFGPNGVVGLVDLLKSESCYSLQELKLNNNGLGIGGGKMLAECLNECHKSSVSAGRPLSLRVFISGRNRLENDGAIALASAFKAIGTLEFLAMPQNGINHQGISALADAVAANKQLKHLNLNDNTFTAKGAEAIAKALPKLYNLEVINFGDCLVRTEGAKAIANALREGHKNLQELILSGNEINKAGAIDIVESLEDKSSLKKLDLDANNFGEEGCEDIKSMVESVGLQEALGSLSGDEGSGDEDEDGDDYGEDEEPDEEDDGEISTDSKLQIKGVAITPNKPQISARDFLAFPSPTKLLQLGKDGGDMFLKELGEDSTDVEKVVSMIIKVSLVISKDDEAKQKACECADSLLQNVMNQNPEAGSLIINSFLVLLGLLKGEDKKLKPPTYITGPLLVLEHVVKQPYFPKFGRDILQIFMSKPHPQLEKSSDARHRLLQTLYAF